MTGARVVRDRDGEPVTLADLGPIDPAPEHTHVERVEGCWACDLTWMTRAEKDVVILSLRTYGCTVKGCEDVAVQGHVCDWHDRRTA